MDYTYIDSDSALNEAIERWSKLERIAVDFEGEFNLHIYGEHLCLIQIFDNERFYIVDPRSSITKNALCAFFASPVEKVWFDSQSDSSLVYKNYGVTINNIFDLRVLAIALGYTGNLRGLEETYLGVKAEGGGSKKKNQTSNWLNRPITETQIEYALEDVKYLLSLKDVLVPLIKENNLEKRVEGEMAKARKVKTPEPGWKKIGNWKRLSAKERVFVRNIFIARDNIAKRFNVPAVRVMEKHFIISLGTNPPHSIEQLAAILHNQNPRFMQFLVPSVWEAIEKSRKETC